MGTRALIKVYDKDDEMLTQIYHHYDGYPRGVGKELAEFLLDRKIVNGFNDPGERAANGMGNLAAQLIYHFVQVDGMVGNVYIEAPSDDVEEYVYEVHFGGRDDECYVICFADGEMVFHGLPMEMLGWIESEECQ